MIGGEVEARVHCSSPKWRREKNVERKYNSFHSDQNLCRIFYEWKFLKVKFVSQGRWEIPVFWFGDTTGANGSKILRVCNFFSQIYVFYAGFALCSAQLNLYFCAIKSEVLRYWGIEKEEKSPTLRGNRTHKLKSFAPQTWALLLCLTLSKGL